MSQGVTVRHGFSYHLFLWTALPFLGAFAGWGLSFVPGWVDELAWFPFQGLFELLGQLTGTAGTIVLVVLGALIGAFCAFLAYDEIIVVEVEPAEVTITRGDDVTRTARQDVAAVFVEGKDLVLTDARGAELVRRTQDHEVEDLRNAFTRMQYPWRDDHPFADAYTRWAPGMPGLPDGADAYLRERQVALEKDRTSELRELRRELARLGVYVRDEKKKQYFRLVD